MVTSSGRALSCVVPSPRALSAPHLPPGFSIVSQGTIASSGIASSSVEPEFHEDVTRCANAYPWGLRGPDVTSDCSPLPLLGVH